NLMTRAGQKITLGIDFTKDLSCDDEKI
ncbi:MAG: hypothetical protein ACI9B9_001617, partial [Halioglobus sp.]